MGLPRGGDHLVIQHRAVGSGVVHDQTFHICLETARRMPNCLTCRIRRPILARSYNPRQVFERPFAVMLSAVLGQGVVRYTATASGRNGVLHFRAYSTRQRKAAKLSSTCWVVEIHSDVAAPRACRDNWLVAACDPSFPKKIRRGRDQEQHPPRRDMPRSRVTPSVPQIHNVNVTAQPHLVTEVPRNVVRVLIDHNLVTIPPPITDEAVVVRGDAKVEAAEPKALPVTSCKPEDMPRPKPPLKRPCSQERSR
jgi:hypothetical protein